MGLLVMVFLAMGALVLLWLIARPNYWEYGIPT